MRRPPRSTQRSFARRSRKASTGRDSARVEGLRGRFHDLQEGAFDEPLTLSDDINQESVLEQDQEEEELGNHGSSHSSFSDDISRWRTPLSVTTSKFALLRAL